MTEYNDNSDIKDTDIVFDCPFCSKSLAIDYRGAGLSIKCSDCGADVQVPIPDGMELGDIDSSDEEQEVRIINLRRSLSAAQYRTQQLEQEVRDLKKQRTKLEKTRTEGLFHSADIIEHADNLSDTLSTAAKTAYELLELCRKELAPGDKETAQEHPNEQPPPETSPEETSSPED